MPTQIAMNTSRFAFFDLGNVLIHFDHQLAVDAVRELSGKPQSEVQQVLFDSGLQNRYETGRIQSEDYATEVNRALGTNIPVARILKGISDIFSPNPSIISALERVRAAGVPMNILSNTCAAHWQWILDQDWPLPGDWFEDSVLSFEVKSMKPARRIYEFSEAKASCPVEQIFFTDDRPENIEAARQRGWTTHLYRNVEELEVAIDAWLSQP